MLKPNDPFFLPSENESEREIELSDTGTDIQEESAKPKKPAGGRQKKAHIPQPQFNRVTRSQTRNNAEALAVFYEYAYYSAIAETITADPSTVKEALATADADK